MKLFFCMAIVALLCGCAGTNFSFDNARQIKPGMKSAEVQKRMGKPYMVTTQGNQNIWVYSYVDAFFATKTVSFVFQDDQVVQVPRIPDSFR